MTSKVVQEILDKRLEILQSVFSLAVKKVVLIRPCLPGDNYTQLGSNVWADLARQKAIDEGWQVTDLSANGATRAQIEAEINSVKPHLILHYDHGSNFTMYGQESDASVPGLDEANIDLAAGRFVSTVSCLSASGLGPTAISDGITTYMGYTDLHYFTFGYQDRFGQAANVANFALLEGKTAQEAFDLGWQAYDDLYDQLLAGNSYESGFVAPFALHDRDCFALLGSTTARATPSIYLCRLGLPAWERHCLSGHPDMVLQCKIGQPNSAFHCKVGLPDLIGYGCPLGQPNYTPPPCWLSSPDPIPCDLGPFTMCGISGPEVMHIRDIYEEITRDLVVIDMNKVPSNLRKSLQSLLKRMKAEK